MTEAQLELRRGLIAEMIRQTACRPDVGKDARRVFYQIAKALTATPGVDGTCRTCGVDLPTSYSGRTREYCSDRCGWVYRKRMSRKESRKSVNE